MNKMFLAALLAISGGSIATADTLLGRVADSEGNPLNLQPWWHSAPTMSKEGPSPTASAITESTFRKDNIT